MIGYVAGIGVCGHKPLENGISAVVLRVHPIIQNMGDAIDDAQEFIPYMTDALAKIDGREKYKISGNTVSAPYLEPGYELSGHSISCTMPDRYFSYDSYIDEIFMTPEKVRNIEHQRRCHAPGDYPGVSQTLTSYIQSKIIPRTDLEQYISLPFADNVLIKLSEMACYLYAERHPSLAKDIMDISHVAAKYRKCSNSGIVMMSYNDNNELKSIDYATNPDILYGILRLDI